MKIVQVIPHILDIPLPYPIRLSFGEMRSRRHMYVEIVTEEGLTGIGEVWTNHPFFNAQDKRFLLDTYLSPLLVGKSFDTPTQAYRYLEQTVLQSGAGKQWGALGHLTQAISGIDIALWDIYAQQRDLPLYRAICDTARPRPIAAYASGLGPDHIESCVQQALAKGMQMFKLKVGFSPKQDLDNLALMRSLIGDKQLFLDANQKFADADTAVSALKQYADYGFGFIEEPVCSYDYAAMRAVRDQGFKIACGENCYSLTEFSNLLWADCADIFQPDVGKCGGITPMLDIAALAAKSGKSFAPHMFSTVIGQTASLHVLTAIGGLFMEVDGNANPALTDLAKTQPFVWDQGRFLASDCRGLGVILDKDFLAEYELR